MSTTESVAPPRAVARVYGGAAILAPLLMLASTVAFIIDGDGLNVGVLGGVIGVWSALALVIAFVGILRLLEPRAPRAAAVMTPLALAGFASGVAFDVQAVFDQIVGPAELEAALDAAIAEGGTAGMVILAFLPWGLFGPLSLVVCGIMLWRTRVTAHRSAALLVAGGVLFVVSRMERIDALAMVADGVLILALVPIGWSMLTGRIAAHSGHPVPASA